MMVVEFSHRLREELTTLQSISQQQGQVGTSDTGRMSMDSIWSQESEGSKDEDDVALAMNTC